MKNSLIRVRTGFRGFKKKTMKLARFQLRLITISSPVQFIMKNYFIVFNYIKIRQTSTSILIKLSYIYLK